jgi:Mrp family chromosome partitioning ATPase
VTSGPDPEPQAKLVPLTSPARFVIAVAAGKGGVGKSTISLNLALALVAKGRRVGLLDADFYGPDIPLMIGLKQTKPLTRWALWRHQELEPLCLEPVTRYGLKIMSVGLLLGEQQALAWPAQMIEFVGRQFLTGVDWGELDYLVIDSPQVPATSSSSFSPCSRSWRRSWSSLRKTSPTSMRSVSSKSCAITAFACSERSRTWPL